MNLLDQIQDNKKGVLLIYTETQQAIEKVDLGENFELIIKVQQFKIRVAAALMEISNYRYAHQVLISAMQVLEEKCPLEKCIYNQAALGLMKCEVYLRNPIKSEILAKRIIDKGFLDEKKLFRELCYESNTRYWAHKYSIYSRVGILLIIVCLIMVVFPVHVNTAIKQLIGVSGALVFTLTKVIRILNQDFVSLDLLEIFVVPNKLRDWINNKYNFDLGRQEELEMKN